MASQITTSAVPRELSATLGGRRPAMTGELNGWFDRSVLDVEGEPIGIVVEIAPDLASERPSWLIIYCGLRDRPIVVAPVRGASLLGEHVVIAHHRSIVVSAPAVDDLAALSGDDHRSLSRHYAVPVIRRVPKPGGTCLDIGAETEDVVVDEHVRKEQFAMEDDPTTKRD